MWWNWTFVNESISELCSSPFWDTNLTWNSTNPDFTPCFERTALVWLPCLFLWLFSPLEIYFLRHSASPRSPFNRFILLKLVFAALLGMSALMDVVNYAHWDEEQTLVDVYGSIIKFFTFCLFFILTYYNAKYGIKSSGILFVFSFLLVLCGAPQVRTEIKSGLFIDLRDTSRYEVVGSVLYFTFYLSSIAVFILNCFADYRFTATEILTRQNECPENDSSVLSRFTFSWFSEFVWKGYWKTLDADDLWDVDDDLRTAQLSRRLESNWLRLRDELLQYRIRVRMELDEQDPLEDGEVQPEWRYNIRPKVPLLCPLVKTFGSYYMYGAIFKIIVSSMIFIGPLLLNLILEFIDDRNELLWHGYLYSIALLVFVISRSILLNQHFHITYRIGLKIYAALVALIYKKALKMSSRARMKYTVGEIVNLMAVDAKRFKDAFFSISLLWGAPLEFCITLYLLWNILGSSVLISVLIICIFLLPINYYLLSKCSRFQIDQMQRKDQRVKLMTQMLTGIKVLKMYAWEPSFQDEISRIRDREIDVIRKMCYVEAGSNFLYYISLMILTVVSFGVFVLSSEKHVLDARVAFVSLSLFQSLGYSLMQLLYVFSDVIPISVSLKRIETFLNVKELYPNATSHEPRPEAVVIQNATFSYFEFDSYNRVLRDVNLEVEAGKLVAVVGMVGSGKSSLLSAILGDLYRQSGYVNTTGIVAYVPQQAWIRNTTLKENITLGVQKEDGTLLYHRVVEACALTPDIRILPARDETEIGEKGINLSGGQKQRISLARAVYSEADTYLLDDTLSAVDSHVAKHIFERVIGPNGLLKSKTRILVTHNVTYLPQVDLIIVLKDGHISESGTYQELAQKEGEFADFLATYVKEESNTDDETYEDARSRESSTSHLGISHQLSGTEENSSAAETGAGRLIGNEETETGNVKVNVFKYYLRAMGLGLVASTILLNLLRQGLTIGSGFWLATWSADTVSKSDPDRARKEYFYLAVYVVLYFGAAVSLVAQDVVLYTSLLRAAKRIHNYLLTAVLRWPANAFDKIPLGRIINRFSSDVEVVDNTLREIVSDFFQAIAKIMSTVFVVSYTTPIFIIVFLPMMIFYYLVQRIFIATSRQLRRLESVSQSPIFSHFEETITGAHSIRAYNLQSKFIRDSENLVDINQKSSYLGFVVNRWLSVRLEFVGALIVFFASLFAVYARNTINAGFVGLSITYAIGVANTLYFWVRTTAEGETNVVAVERIKEYVDMEQEAPWTLPSDRNVPDYWPFYGNVVYKNVHARYQTWMQPVLKGISFNVRSGTKVGIVGRTGAGKTSLMLSLLRLIESCDGEISIDGIDISKIGLHTLRKRLTIIPQDAILFAGTLRMNLDPSHSFSDNHLLKACEFVQLNTSSDETNVNLYHQVQDGGSNFSMGQRQLICLARAILRKTRVLILDEATAAIDVETDDKIQKVIRKAFDTCTVLIVAHRLNTVMDCDKILVLDGGTVIEYDSPATLMQSKKSAFYAMAADAGLAPEPNNLLINTS